MKGKFYNNTIFDNSPYGLVLTDRKGIIVDSNPVFASLTGKTVEQLRDTNYIDLLSISKKASQFSLLQDSLNQNGSIGPVKSYVLNSNGNDAEVLLSATILEDDGDHLICWFVEDTDFTVQNHKSSNSGQALLNNTDLNTALANSILETAVDGIVTITAKGIINSFNPAAEKMFGYQKEEVIGQNISILMPEPFRTEHNSYLSNYRKTGKKKIIGVGRETRAVKKDGSEFEIHVAVSECHYNDSQYYTGIIHDISDKKRSEYALQESEERFRRAFESGSIGMAIVSLDKKWQKVNDSLCGILEFTRSELLSSSYDCLLYPDDTLSVSNEMEALLKSLDSTHIQKECRFLSKHGDIKWVDFSASLIRNRNNQPLYFVFQINDITQRINAEREIRQSREQAENASQAKSDFLYSLSHELRTPLTAIMGFTDILQSSESLNSQEIEDLAQIKKASQFILQLVKDLLNLAKIESKQMDLELSDVNLVELVDQSTTLIRQSVKEKNITIITEGNNHIDKDLIVYVDPLRTKQVILNLLSNAAKYNRDNGSITIVYQCSHPEKVRLSITDTGEGIPEEKIKKLFQPFNRLGAEKSKVEGTGIGLVIAKTLMQKMGGEIGVYSSEGEGCTFWLEFKKYHQENNHLPSLPNGLSDIKSISNNKLRPTLLDNDHSINSKNNIKNHLGLRKQLYKDFHFHCNEIIQELERAISHENLHEVSRGFRSLQKCARQVGCYSVSKLCEQVFYDLSKTSWIDLQNLVSKIKTLLPTVSVENVPGNNLTNVENKWIGIENLNTIIVDDDEISSDYTEAVLKRLNINPKEKFTSAQRALESLTHNPSSVNLIFSDLNMPGIDGTEFIRRLSEIKYPGLIVLVSGVKDDKLAKAEHLAAILNLNILGSLEKPIEERSLDKLLKSIVNTDQLSEKM